METTSDVRRSRILLFRYRVVGIVLHDAAVSSPNAGEQDNKESGMNMDDEEETTVSDEERKQDRSGPSRTQLA